MHFLAFSTAYAWIGGVLLLFGVVGSQAQERIYRCENPEGGVEYRNAGNMQGCKPIETHVQVSIPGAVRGRSALTQPSVTAGAFPRVGTALQQQRDQARREVLEQELRIEETKVTSLRREIADRAGNGAQKDVQATKLQLELARSTENMAALQRELSKLKP